MSEQTKAQRLADILQYKIPSMECLEEAAAELRRLDRHEQATRVWSKKTEWVQETAKPGELGMHRADVMKKRIDDLTALNAELVAALEKLARLGNGDSYGNSIGNDIAIAALAKAKGEA